MKDLSRLRQEYTQEQLDQKDVLANPLQQFQKWLDEALNADLAGEATAMHLSTATRRGKPSARIVLLKGVDHGFLFYTNYHSQKGEELGQNPYVALTFFWPELERQVRVEGSIEKLTPEASTEYFQQRPRGSQVAAIASPQSRPVQSREFLERRFEEIDEKYQGEEKLPRPPEWGGYRVLPERIEFWQGRRSRLHDRICYTRSEAGVWHLSRLAP